MTNPRWLARASRRGMLAVWCSIAVSSGALGLWSCRRSTENVNHGPLAVDASTDPARTGISAPPASIDGSGFLSAKGRACRVMALRGTATVTFPFPQPSTSAEGDGQANGAAAPRPIARGDLVPEAGLIELASGGELTLQATVSAREITLVGPATFEACPGGDEAVRLSRGKVTAFPGVGVRSGAEVWVATPLGVVRFGDAKIEMAIADRDATRLEIAVIGGHATWVPAAGVVAHAAPAGALGDGSDASVDAGSEVIALGPGTTLEANRRGGAIATWVRDLVAACGREADAAREAARRVRSPPEGARASLGDLAFAHVAARQRARAACETARAAAALGPGQLDAGVRAAIERADAIWKSGLPSPPASSGVPAPSAPTAD